MECRQCNVEQIPILNKVVDDKTYTLALASNKICTVVEKRSTFQTYLRARERQYHVTLQCIYNSMETMFSTNYLES